MTGRTLENPQLLDYGRRRSLIVATFVTAAYLAAVIALFGFTSLLTNTDVIVEPDAGPLLGPAMVFAACGATFVWLATARGARLSVWRMLSTGASIYALMLLVGAVGYAWTRGEPIWLVLFTGRYATSPFVIGAALLADMAFLAQWAVDRRPATD